jgi:hypothetical protein
MYEFDSKNAANTNETLEYFPISQIKIKGIYDEGSDATKLPADLLRFSLPLAEQINSEVTKAVADCNPTNKATQAE